MTELVKKDLMLFLMFGLIAVLAASGFVLSMQPGTARWIISLILLAVSITFFHIMLRWDKERGGEKKGTSYFAFLSAIMLPAILSILTILIISA